MIRFSDAARAQLDAAVFVSGNANKVLEAERICGFPIEHAAVDLPEVQSMDLAHVAEEKALAAIERLRQPVLVEETGLELAATNGFPGPLVKWMLESIGPEGIATTALALSNPVATAVCRVVLYDGETFTAGEGQTRGELVLPPRGEQGFGWDPVFRPDDEEHTYGELSDERKDEIGHRGRAWRDLARRLG